jgi:proteasome beta subunit
VTPTGASGVAGPLGPLGSLFPRPFEASPSSFTASVIGDAAVSTLGPLTPELRRTLAEGTTVLATLARDGVVVAGDRRATAGHAIARADLRKVFPADSHSAIAVSGTAGPAIELARVFATELEHHEKVEGRALTLDGKSSRLAGLVRAHLPMALQGLVVVPLLAGVEPTTGRRAIYEFDPVGGRYVAARHAAVGSGAAAARGVLKRRADVDGALADAVVTALLALREAADEDSATGGPDVPRGAPPIVAIVDVDGYRELDDDEVAAVVADLGGADA